VLSFNLHYSSMHENCKRESPAPLCWLAMALGGLMHDTFDFACSAVTLQHVHMERHDIWHTNALLDLSSWSRSSD
jgi:hypothetical protein